MTVKLVPGGTVTSPGGFLAGATYAGIRSRSQERGDMGLLFSEFPAAAAGVFTSNRVKAAPILLCRKHLESRRARAIVVNAGCANAGTGEQGARDAAEMAALAAKKLGVSAQEVLVASTGVIGVPMPMDKVRAGIEAVSLSQDGGHGLALAITTTDTRTKEVAASVEMEGNQFVIGGIAKGAGMIHPNMATLLVFLTTDAQVAPEFLDAALRRAVDASFNMITVDGDTSTNDCALILANGAAGNEPLAATSPAARAFEAGLELVCVYLAKAVARDGEGATRLIEVTVEGAQDLGDARKCARAIVRSPLVKAAVYGCDPNWGRILAAAGYSGAGMEPDKVDIFVGGVHLLGRGQPLPYDREAARHALGQPEVTIRVHLNLGDATALAWGCDLSPEYVTINSAYTT